MLGSVVSKNNIHIRLTEERWIHIITAHPEINSADFSRVLNIIQSPDVILKGDLDELLAVQKQTGKSLWFVVVYKEVKSDDGFVLTAYITTDDRWLFKRKIIWNKI